MRTVEEAALHLKGTAARSRLAAKIAEAVGDTPVLEALEFIADELDHVADHLCPQLDDDTVPYHWPLVMVGGDFELTATLSGIAQRDCATYVGDGANLLPFWEAAPIIVVADTQLDVAMSMPRRDNVIVLGTDPRDESVWGQALKVGATYVVFLPNAEPWLRDRFHAAVPA